MGPMNYFLRLYFLEQFKVHRKIEVTVRWCPMYTLPPHMHSLPHWQHPYQSGTCSSWWTCTDALWSLKVHRFHYSHACCTFCGSGQMYRDIYPSLWYYVEYFHCLKHYLCFASLSPHCPHPPLARIDLFTVSIVLSFPECHVIEIVKIMTFIRLAPLT